VYLCHPEISKFGYLIMEKRIELEKRGRPAEEILELNLDNCRATQIEGLTEDFKALESLSLINVGLTTLKGFPSLPNLRKLELSDNRISSGLNLLQGCSKLTHLNLSGNKIRDIETLEPLKNLPELKNLDLFNCEVTNMEDYRDQVFELLDGLQYLDGYDRENQELEDEEEEDGEVDGDEDVDEEDDDEDDDDDDDEEDNVVDVDEDGEEDFDEEEVEDEEDEEGEVGLEYLQKEGIEEESEGDDFDPEGGEEEEDVGEEEEEEEEDGEEDGQRGIKRKHEDEEDQ